MLLRWLLSETKAGNLLLALLERTAGTAVVQGEWLAGQPSGTPHAASGR
jgi:hypothetical protein